VRIPDGQDAALRTEWARRLVLHAHALYEVSRASRGTDRWQAVRDGARRLQHDGQPPSDRPSGGGLRTRCLAC
jgi:hypothetical protein